MERSMLGKLLHRARAKGATFFAFFIAVAILALPGTWTSQFRLAARLPLPWRQPAQEVSRERKKIRLLREEIARMGEENLRLRAMLRECSAFQKVPPDFAPDRILPASVLLRGDSDGLRQGITIGAGREEGVGPGDPVLQGRSLVGVVQEAGPHRSSVRLVTDPESRTAAFGLGFQEEVMIEGRGEDRLRIRFESALVDPVQGEEIITVEEGGIPRGLILGRIDREGRKEIVPLWRRENLETVRVLIQKEEEVP